MEYTIAGDLATVTLRGEFTFTDHQAFRKLAERLFASGASSHAVVFELEHVTFIDSAGLGMLLIARDEALKKNRRLVLKGATGQVKKMFDVSRFETLFALET